MPHGRFVIVWCGDDRDADKQKPSLVESPLPPLPGPSWLAALRVSTTAPCRYGCGQFRQRISVDFVSISSPVGVPPSAVPGDMQSVRLSVPSPPIGPPLPPEGPSTQLGRLGPAGLVVLGPEGATPAISPSSVQLARSLVRSYLAAQMFPTLTYLSERAYRRPPGSPTFIIVSSAARRVPFPSGSTTTSADWAAHRSTH